MAKTLSVRWHSRAGQGAITASTALAEILGENGKFVQSFPDFGAEKRGAAVVVYNRISSQKIYDVSHPEHIDAVVLLDTTLVSSCELPTSELLSGLTKAGNILVNTDQDSLGFIKNAQTAHVLDASKIALEEIGKDIPNVPILGALVKILNLAKLKDFLPKLKSYLSKNLPTEIVEGNLKAFERGYTELKKAEPKATAKQKSSGKCKKLPSWKEVLPGGTVDQPGSSRDYDTGNWTPSTCKWKKKTCINCTQCWIVCPHSAVKLDKDGNMIGIDEKKCTACGLCIDTCPTQPKSLEIVKKKKASI